MIFNDTIVALSKRESEVLELLCHGLTDKEAGAKLGITLGTIRVYRKRMQSKLNTQGLVQSALVAWRLGQLDLEALADDALAQSRIRDPLERAMRRAGSSD